MPKKLSLSDFCDMKIFDQMLHDWSTSTGLATVAVGSDGKYVTGYYNFTDFCEKLTRKSPEGLRRCIECDKKGKGTYLCHAGLVDFATPITLEDGTVVGNIVGGQVLPEQPDEKQFRTMARELGIDAQVYIEALRKVNVRTTAEIKASANLLADVVNMFVRTSYAARQSAKSLLERHDIISSLSKIYFCDYYINLETRYFQELDATKTLRAFVGKSGNLGTKLEDSAKIFLEAEYVEPYLKFIDLATLQERLDVRPNISLEFIVKKIGWCRGNFIVVNRNTEGHAAYVIYAIQKIQEEKERELRTMQLLKATAEEANRANQVKSDFLARMSHDMRTPLTTIIGLSDIAIKEYKDENLLHYFQTIKRSSQYLQSILTDVLDMQKLASGTITLQPEICPPSATAKMVEGIIRPMAVAKKINFIIEFHCSDSGCYPLADTRRMQQIIINLLNNAVKYTQVGGEIRWTIQVLAENKEKIKVVHTIADNGPGMSKQFQKVMFEPFTQAKDSADSNGSGLGLAIVKKLVDMMEGTITCKSTPGKGTVFTVTVPHIKANKRQIANYLHNKKATNSISFDRCCVLICEDNMVNARIIKKLLEQENIIVDHAVDGAQAVKMAQTQKYNAILMDIRMPVLDGYAAAQAIRKFDTYTPIIALSANNFPEDINKSLACGMNAHLAKPIDIQLLFATLHNFFINGRKSSKK